MIHKTGAGHGFVAAESAMGVMAGQAAYLLFAIQREISWNGVVWCDTNDMAGVVITVAVGTHGGGIFFIIFHIRNNIPATEFGISRRLDLVAFQALCVIVCAVIAKAMGIERIIGRSCAGK